MQNLDNNCNIYAAGQWYAGIRTTMFVPPSSEEYSASCEKLERFQKSVDAVDGMEYTILSVLQVVIPLG